MVPLWMIGAASKVKDIAKKIPWQVWACAGVLISFWVWGKYQHHLGAKEVQAKWDASVKRGTLIVEQIKKKQPEIIERVRVEYRDKIKVIHEKGETIVKRIPEYIPVNSCPLPGGFRVLHDAAAGGYDPGPAEGVNAAPVAVATVAETVAKNYTLCKTDQQRLSSLQSYIQQQKQVIEELCKLPDAHCNVDS